MTALIGFNFGGGGVGGVLLYINYIGMCHPKGYGFWAYGVSGLKMGVHFAHFGLELGMAFEGSMRMYEHIYHFSSK